MLHTFNILGIVFYAARWGLLVSVCFLLWRRLAIRSLPWLAAHYAIVILASPVTSYLLKSFLIPSEGHPGSFQTIPASTSIPFVYLSMGLECVWKLNSLLVVLLVVSEVAYFTSIHYPNIESKVFSWLRSVRLHAKIVGIALILFSLIYYFATFFFWSYYHGGNRA